ncbi:DeoR/GlpR transcriptional regulator, partial [Listeria monocytogenes]|nr:DeoR/GlpR transcriptional regulator [Listeria monocytogenes]
EEKRRIAERAVTYIEDDMTIFVDSSSTALHLIPYLKKIHGLRVVTNSVLTAALLSEHTAAEVTIVGGTVTNKKFTVNSVTAVNQLRTYHFDLALLSCRGYDEEKGATENTEGEAVFKQVLKDCTEKIILMVLESKRNKVYFYKSLLPEDIDIVI